MAVANLPVVAVRIALAQINPVVGDLAGNAEMITTIVNDLAQRDAADLVVFPELALTGYPPEDLLLRPAFLDDVHAAINSLAKNLALPSVVGAPLRAEQWNVAFQPSSDSRDRSPLGADFFSPVLNAAVICGQGEVLGIATKRFLPNYDVFDEARYFYRGEGPATVLTIAGQRCSFVICEDVWIADGPAHEAAQASDVVVVMNASPFARGRRGERHAVVSHHARHTQTPFLYLNQLGGQDELIFDGASFVADATGAIVHEMPSARDAVHVVTVEDGSVSVDQASSPVTDELGEIYDLLTLATHDYVTKSGFRSVVIALSGGIDSAIVATIAADALGPQNVTTIAMPSRYSSEHSLSDAYELARRQHIACRTAGIEAGHQAIAGTVGDALGHEIAGLTDENLQSRVRGVILMAWSNDTGSLVLTTGNKSELAVGYSTLYGDTAGAFAVIKDVPKTLVYELCRWRNQRDGVEVIPVNILEKAPSAELRPDQRDDQSLPPYEILDPLIERYVDFDQPVAQIVAAGFDEEVVRRITRLIDLAEYKRRQSPLGPRISGKAFGKDRRLPLTNRFRG